MGCLSRGGVVAGSSAGAAVMSRMMFREARSVLRTLENGVQMGKELAPGLGFLDPSWFVDQHCLARGRFARCAGGDETRWASSMASAWMRTRQSSCDAGARWKSSAAAA